MPDPFIIMSAPNGARLQKTDHPALPITPDELAECAVRICDAGASILHLHVRDDNNQHTLNVARYRAAIAAIRAAIGQRMIIQVTSEAVGRYSCLEQMQMVKDLKPEAVSLALRELCPTDRSLVEFAQFIDWLAAARIMPQYILYNESDARQFEAYRKKGVFLNDAPFALFVLGQYRASPPGQTLKPNPLLSLSKKVDYPWAVCGFGAEEIHAITHASQCNGHIRVGFENSILQKNGSLLPDHKHMITLCVEASNIEDRPVATVDDIKNMQKWCK